MTQPPWLGKLESIVGTDVTVLLVDPEELPPGLEAQLSAKGAFVETTTSSELEHAVIAVAPDLVLSVASAKTPSVLEVLGRQEPVTQLALLADWRQHRELRARRARPLGALLSKDMPIAVLAARVADLAQKAARGQPLHRTLAPPAPSEEAAPSSGALPGASAAPKTADLLARRTLLGVGTPLSGGTLLGLSAAPGPPATGEGPAKNESSPRGGPATPNADTSKEERVPSSSAAKTLERSPSPSSGTPKTQDVAPRQDSPKRAGLGGSLGKSPSPTLGHSAQRERVLGGRALGDRALGDRALGDKAPRDTAATRNAPRNDPATGQAPTDETSTSKAASSTTLGARGRAALGDREQGSGALGSGGRPRGGLSGGSSASGPNRGPSGGQRRGPLGGPGPSSEDPNREDKGARTEEPRAKTSSAQTSSAEKPKTKERSANGFEVAKSPPSVFPPATLATEPQPEAAPALAVAHEPAAEPQREVNALAQTLLAPAGASLAPAPRTSSAAEAAFAKTALHPGDPSSATSSTALPPEAAFAKTALYPGEPRSAAEVAPLASSASSPAVLNAPSDDPEHLVLTLSQRPLPPLRLALVDTDLTRAGALSDELRARGAATQLLAPEVDATRWHLLRRFSPHALIVDERAVGAHGAWLERVRRDPFLGHVPLLPAPLERLFQENSGRADIHALVPLLLSLGAEEFALRNELRPGRSVEVRLDQLGPLRLVEIVGAHPRPCSLVCTAGPLCLTWSFRAGLALGAQLTGPSGAPESVPPAAALEWLLAHPECRVRVNESEDARGGAILGEAVPIDRLLEESTRHEALPSSPPPAPPRELRMLGGSAPATEPLPRASARFPAFLEAASSGSRRLGASARERLEAVVSRWRVLPRAARFGALGGAGLVVCVLVARLATGSGNADGEVTSQIAGAEAETATTQAAPAPPPEKGAEASTTAPEDEPPFQVAPDAKLPPCTGDSGEARGNGTTFLQRARQRLVAGDVEAARELMCQAARLEPSGPAAESLALLFLSSRSLDNAKHWAEVALQHDPQRRTARELLGDIENQRGNVAASREIWLSTMQLTGDEIARIDAVSRQQVREGLSAIESRDLPRAERYFRRAITLQPKNAAAAAGLARVLAQLGFREAGLAWAKRAISLDPGIRVSLGADFRELGPG